MYKTDITKKMLCDSLLNLIKETEFDKISISDIVNNCGASRRTFYYHFKDKQDLICWMFDRDIEYALGSEEFVTDKDGEKRPYINALTHYLYEKREIYSNVLRSTAQNSLREHLFDYIYQYRKKQILRLLNGREMDELGINFLAEYFTHAIVGILLSWAEGGMKYPPEKFDRGYKDVTTNCMGFIVDFYTSPSHNREESKYNEKYWKNSALGLHD